MIDTIIFDAEGVIIDTEIIWDEAQRTFLGRRGLTYDRTRLKPLMTGKSLVDGVRVMQEVYGFGGDAEEQARERLAIVEELFATKTSYIPGFPEFFGRIRGAYKHAVATAMADRLVDIVDGHLGWRQLFDGRIFSVAMAGGRSKPAPDVFLHAAAALGSDPASCLVIEDAPYGIEAARRAGMRCVALTTTYGPELLAGADLVVSSFAAIDPAGLSG